MTKKTVRLKDIKPKGIEFGYKPSGNVGPPVVLDATLSVKFSQTTRILDDWYLFGGTPWTRTLFRLRHPIVYSKRGLRNLWRRFKRVFTKPKMVQPLANFPWDRKSK